jgi:hypothetical protein
VAWSFGKRARRFVALHGLNCAVTASGRSFIQAVVGGCDSEQAFARYFD